MHTVSATTMKNRFGTFLREVMQTGGPLLIERAGQPVAVLLSLDAYRATCPPGPRQIRERTELARAAFGMWAGREDVDDSWVENGRRNRT